ncbi:MAG: ATP-binding protein [Thermoprotei archaeon]
MGLLKRVTEEYLGGLQFVREVPREVEVDLSTPDITVLAGPRRAGKTFLMLKAVKSLLNRGENAVYLSLDDPLFRDMSARELAEKVRAEYPEGKVYLFLDEVQDWRDWDFNLRWLHDVKDFKLVVSGSSSTLLSSEIPSRLRGRQITQVVLPFSLREVFTRRGDDFRERGRFRSVLNDYLTWGGFPEVWIYRSRQKLLEVVETVFYRDLVERNRVREVEQFRAVMDFVLSNYSNQLSWNRVAKALRGMGVEADVKTVMNYVEYMRRAFLAFTVKKFDLSERRRAIAPKKVYLVDLGIATLYEREESLGRKLKNLVFLELFRRGWEVGYYVTRRGEEVDFVARKGAKRVVVEVSLRADEGHVRKVRDAMTETNSDEGFVVVLEGETKEVNGVKVVELGDWLWALP